MRVFTFQPRFQAAVASGAKRRTIRARANCKPGDELSLRKWEGKPYRSKQRLLATRRCVWVSPIQIIDEGIIWLWPRHASNRIALSTDADLDAFAMADGFANWEDMRECFRSAHGLPFSGELIEWE